MPEPGVYGWSHGTGGVHFHRMAEPIRVLAAGGGNVATGNRLDDAIAERFDTILVHMLHEPVASEAWRKLAINGQHRMVFDCDDAMWWPDWSPFAEAYTPEVLDQLFVNVKLAHVVTTPSKKIAEYLAQWNPNVWYVPNTVPQMLLKSRPRNRARPILGYQGSPSHVTDVDAAFEKDMAHFKRMHPDWKLKLWGADSQSVSVLDDQTIVVPWEPDVRRYYRTLSMDIGMGPLAPSRFNECKSGLRAIEYAAAGIVAVLSESPAYEEWVMPGKTGFLIPPGERWFPVLDRLADAPELRETIAFDARLMATGWTTEYNVGNWVRAWDSV